MPGEFRPIDEFMYRWQASPTAAVKRGRYGLLRSLVVRAVRHARALPFVFDYP